MPKIVPSTIVICAIGLLTGAVAVPTAHAQQLNGNITTQAPNLGSGPIFSIPNFEGDVRAGDEYAFMHFTSKDPWNTYRLQVQQIAQQSFLQQPTQQDPTPATAGPDAMAASTMAAAGVANAGMAANALGGGGNTVYAGGYSTSVSGSVQGQPMSNVPGLVGP